MMKKIFALVVLLVLGKFSYSQSYPLQQSLGSDSTIVISKGALQSRLIPIVITDTASASAQRMKNYPGAQLYTSNGNFYIRNASATKWLLISSGSVGSINIYNSDGTLTGARTVNGGNDELLFQNFARYSVEANTGGVIELYQGSNSSFIMNNDTSRFSRRVSYSSNLGSSFTKHSLVDKNYVDSSIGSIPSGGTVTSVATNNSTGITGGTITTSGTLAIDTTLISTRAWRQKGIDSVQANINALTFQKSLINGSTLTQNNTVNVNKKGFTWNNGGYYEFNDSLGTTLLSMSKSIIDLFVANAGTGVPPAAVSLGRGVYISGGDSISISPYQGKLNISSLRSGAGSKALKYDPTTGVVSYSDTTAASGGTVTSVATNTATGITGGTITTSGTLAIDTTLISTRAWRQKGVDSVAALIGVSYVPYMGATGPVDLGTYNLKVNGLTIGKGGTDDPPYYRTACTAIGVDVLQNQLSHLDGTDNTAIGYKSMEKLVSSYGNTALGVYTLSNIVDNGYENIAIGNYSLNNLVNGSGNIAIGYSANDAITATNTITIGNYTSNNTPNQIIIGTSHNALRIGTILFSSNGRFVLGSFDNGADQFQANGSVNATQYKLSSLNTAPATSTDTGTTGEIRITSDYIYVCIATNTWVRSALSTF